VTIATIAAFLVSSGGSPPHRKAKSDDFGFSLGFFSIAPKNLRDIAVNGAAGTTKRRTGFEPATPESPFKDGRFKFLFQYLKAVIASSRFS
jgi:hypothetical protein